MLYFCRRGRQNLRQLKKTDFSFNKDSTRARYMCKTTDELTKNSPEDEEGFDGCLMNENPFPNCPVISFELYVGHVNPLNELLFNAPREKSPLLRMFGTTTWRAYTWREKEEYIARSKTFQVLRKPFNQGVSFHSSWQVRFWSKRNPASEAIAKLTFAQRRSCRKPLQQDSRLV